MFKNQLATTRQQALSRQSATALANEIFPAGRCRMAVLGLAASNLRSTIRLKLMAQVLAQTMAARIRRKFFQPGHPPLSLAATTMAATANGRAKTVWENFTNSAHLRTPPITPSPPAIASQGSAE